MSDATSTALEEHLGLEAESDVRALGVSRVRAWTLTVLATLALSITLIDRQSLAAIAVGVTGSLGITDVAYGWLSSAFAGAYLVGSIFGARLIGRIGPRFGLGASVGLASIVVALHAIVRSFGGLLVLRLALGLAVAPAFACAAQTIHFVLPFRDRARGIGMLYMGNSLGSALCPPLVVLLASSFGWRWAFVGAAVIGVAWVPMWAAAGSMARVRATLDAFRQASRSMSFVGRSNVAPVATFGDVLRNPASVRATCVVASSAPVTTIMLLWGAKYLVADHGLSQAEVGHYLWLPPACFGSSSLLFGELRARSARTRSLTRPARGLMLVAALLASAIALVPLASRADLAVLVGSVAMMGSGGLYTLATSDILAHTRTGTVPMATGLTTFTQSLVYVVVSPLVGKAVERFGNYDWVMVATGLWVLPGIAYWFGNASPTTASIGECT